MKILHISVCVEHYNDGWDYQDNLLPLYHQKKGHEVSLITNTLIYDVLKNKVVNSIPARYIYENINISRLGFLNDSRIIRKLRLLKDFKKNLYYHDPDLIFLHGVQFFNLLSVRKFVRKNNIKLIVDGHEDYTNSARNLFSKIFHKTVWRFFAKSIEQELSIYWGVLPNRVEFIKKIYKIQPNKVKLLEMGIDDESLNKIVFENKLNQFKKINQIPNDKIIISTGGKIDKYKYEIIHFLDVLSKVDKHNIHLLVFGSVTSEYSQLFSKLIQNNNITYLGWLNREEIYKTFLISDITIFLGRHSILWETAVAVGKPIVLSRNNYTDYYNLNNNVLILEDLNKHTVNHFIDQISDSEFLNKYKKNAMTSKRFRFHYSRIADKSIQI